MHKRAKPSTATTRRVLARNRTGAPLYRLCSERTSAARADCFTLSTLLLFQTIPNFGCKSVLLLVAATAVGRHAWIELLEARLVSNSRSRHLGISDELVDCFVEGGPRFPDFGRRVSFALAGVVGKQSFELGASPLGRSSAPPEQPRDRTASLLLTILKWRRSPLLLSTSHLCAALWHRRSEPRRPSPRSRRWRLWQRCDTCTFLPSPFPARRWVLISRPQLA